MPAQATNQCPHFLDTGEFRTAGRQEQEAKVRFSDVPPLRAYIGMLILSIVDKDRGAAPGPEADGVQTPEEGLGGGSIKFTFISAKEELARPNISYAAA
jgi:hypothetical protein